MALVDTRKLTRYQEAEIIIQQSIGKWIHVLEDVGTETP